MGTRKKKVRNNRWEKFSSRNESSSRQFLKKQIFTDFSIIWNTRKIRTLFPLKDKNIHPCCVIYEGLCSCDARYMGETDRCVHLRWEEHENVKKSSEPAKHLKGNPGHKFSWKILGNAPNHQSKRKILEALHISKFKPGLNDQIKSTRLKLFPNGVT